MWSNTSRGKRPVSEIPEELKLTDAQIIDTLWKLVVNYKDVRDQVNALWNEVVHHSGEMNLKGDWYRLDKRLRETEEQLEGLMKHYTDTLNEMRANAKRKPKDRLT